MTATGDRRPVPVRARGWSGIPLGRIGGIPIRLSFSWLLAALLIVVLAVPLVHQVIPDSTTVVAVGVAACLAVLLGLSVLVHELGHCLAARMLGIPVLDVRIYLLGGVSTLGRSTVSPKEEAVVAVAGPALSALLAGLFFLLLGGADNRGVGWLLLIQLALANAIVAVFNLLPALPLDGGRVLRAGVWRFSGRRRWGTLAGTVGGYLTAAALVIWSIVQLTKSTQVSVLQAAIGVVMAIFVAIGAAGEHRFDRMVEWPSDQTLASMARQVVQLPAEVPVQLALQAAAGRAVILTAADGVVAGLMDDRAAMDLARTDPRAPALRVSRPIPPETIVLPDESPSDIAIRVPPADPQDLVLVNESGLPAGVIPAQDWSRMAP